MPTIILETQIQAPVQTVFDLSRNIELHMQSTAHTKERAIAGVTSGHISLNETVTWEAVHFGVKQQLTSKITQMQAPHYFVDEMVKGAFKQLRHQHIFTELAENTLMIDIMHYKAPLGWLGSLAEKIYLNHYLRKLLKQRNQYIKHMAEHTTTNLETAATTSTVAKDHPVILFDGDCNLCNHSIQWIIRRDPDAIFRFAPLQSAYSQAILGAPVDMQTIVLIENGIAYTHSTAALRILRKLSSRWKYIHLFSVAPRFLRDSIYRVIARNRHRFIRPHTCLIPTAELKARFIEE